MLSIFQLTVQIAAGLFFVMVAIFCLLWPDKFYEHARRRDYRKTDLGAETGQDLQRTGYVWTVRIMGLTAAIMFFFIVIHVLSGGAGPRSEKEPLIIVPNRGDREGYRPLNLGNSHIPVRRASSTGRCNTI
jgi:hypothetical protein